MTKPTKTTISIPEAFAINGIKADFVEDKIQNGFDNINPDVLAGDNLNKFIDDTYKGLNYSIKGVCDLYTSWAMYDENETYSNKSIVYDFDEDNSLVLYRSLQNENLGHATSESDWWKVVKDQSKANTDMDNLTETGKNEITSYAFPSSRYDELELMPSGQNYTAPADGWYCIGKLIGSVSAVNYVDLHNTSNGIVSTLSLTSGGSGNALRGFLPVMKGEIVKVSYNINGNTEYFRFYYAEGVKE